MSDPSHGRAPSAFDLNDPAIEMDVPLPIDAPFDPVRATSPAVRRTGWATLFWSAAGGLLTLALAVWVQETILSLTARSDWLGWTATALFLVAGFAFIMILAREIAALLRLSAMTATRTNAETALAANDAKQARRAAQAVRHLLRDRPELAHAVQKNRQHDGAVHDARQILTLAERDLLLALDASARATIGQSARRVSVLTSISPAAVLAVGFVAYENFRLLRTLATIYGGRPGTLAIVRLLRMIAGHLAVTGGMALTDGLVQQFVGHGVTARLSRRLGEGLVNGGFTIRIGLAAVDVLRPLPYVEAKRPRVREFLTEFLKFTTGEAKADDRLKSS